MKFVLIILMSVICNMNKKIQDLDLIKCLDNKMTTKEIANMFNISSSLVRSRAEKIGRPFKKILKEKPDKTKQFLNTTHGQLTVLEFVNYEKRKNNTGRESIWKCQCICGKIITVINSRLTSGIIKSCGCSRIESLKKLHKGNVKKEASFYAVLKDYQRGALSRNFEWSLSDLQFKELTSNNCYYCNCKPSKIKSSNGSAIYKGEHYRYNGIDRINNLLGYNTTNCVSCCWECNMIKGRFSQELFLKKIEQIVNFRIKGELSTGLKK